MAIDPSRNRSLARPRRALAGSAVPRVLRQPARGHFSHSDPLGPPWAWQFVRDSYLFWPWFQRTTEHRRALGLPGPEILHERFVEVAKALGTYSQSYRASIVYPHEERLRAMAGVVARFVSVPADVLRSTTETAAAMVPGSEFVEVGDGDPDRPDRVAVIDGWLRRERGDRREPVTR